MGTVHKFKRPPKNQRQFQGYRPGGPEDPRGRGPRRLRGWQKSLLAWSGLVLVATGLWALGITL